MPVLETEPEVSVLQFGQHGKSIQEFFNDGSFIRALIGGRGSGKSFAVATDIVSHLWQNAGGKAIVARETEVSQADSSIDTFWQYFESLNSPLYQSEGLGLFKSWNDGRTFRVPSLLAIQRMQKECAKLDKAGVANWIDTVGQKLCGYIEFRGLPDADKGKFRGMECSYLALIEADQIAKKQFDLSLACLRWKGADPETCDDKGFIKDRCVVLDSNPPGPNHWIAEMERDEEKKEPSDRIARFWHIDTRENEHNLPENYIRDTILMPYANNPAMLERMLHGRYADAFTGKPVYYAFQDSIHTGEDLPWPKGAYLIRSYDQGNPNASIFAAYWVENGCEYWHDLYEIVLADSDADRQSKQALYATDKEFPFWNDRAICAGLQDYCDPAYNATSGTMKIEVNKASVDLSQMAVFRKNGIYPGVRTKSRGLQETIAVVNRLLLKRDAKGRPCYQIDRKGCPQLWRAMAGGYRYPSEGEPGYGKNEPLKGPVCEGLDAVSDAARYGKINCLSLLQAEMERANKPIPWAKPARNINPVR